MTAIWVLIKRTGLDLHWPVKAFTDEARAVAHLEGADQTMFAYYEAMGRARFSKELTDDERARVTDFQQFDPHFSPETRGYYLVAVELE